MNAAYSHGVCTKQAEPEIATFLFADIAGFTALTEAMGDIEAADLVGEFSAQVGPLLGEHSAHVVKTIGDALMLHAHDPAEAITLGLRLAREIGARHRFPAVRVGMHTGSAVERDGDWFGATVNLAARVSALAAGGEVLLTDATARAAGAVVDVELVDRGRHDLRNVAEPIQIYAAIACDLCMPAAELPIDPVCRMAVEPERGAGTVRHRDAEFHFCSPQCIATFTANPDRYAGA